ncbi:hypothetical protein PSTT_13282, partial [Puccinia striiformis]
RVANHSYGLRPRVAPIRVMVLFPVRVQSIPLLTCRMLYRFSSFLEVKPKLMIVLLQQARRSGFVQRPLTPMPVTRNGPVLSNP